MVPDDPERRAVTGGLSLSYAVVPDELAGQLEVRRQVWFVDYAGGDEERTEAELIQLIRPLDLDYALHFSSRLDAYQSIMGSKILALFLGLYLGFTFLLAAAAVLALQQLSQAADNQKRYAMLRRLGADDGLPAGGSGLPDAPGAGPDPLHGGDEGGQRHHCHGGRGGLGGEQPGHSRCADPGLRRLLPGHSPGLPSDGPAELDQA